MDMEESLNWGLLFRTIKKHGIAAVLLWGIFCGAAGFAVSYFVIPKKYESHALLYVSSNDQSSGSVSIDDINAAQILADSCQIIFKSDTVKEQLITKLDLPYTKAALDKMVTARSVNGTAVIELIVESSSAVESQTIVNELVELSVQEFTEIIKSGSIEIIDHGDVDTTPTFPDIPIITAASFLAGLLISYIVIRIRKSFDIVIRQDDNIAQIYETPVFAEIMDFDKAGSGDHRFDGDEKKHRKTTGKVTELENCPYGKFLSGNIPFVITEAYNTARTNTKLAVSESEKKIIAVTSSNPYEGKSTTCANLAIRFADSGVKVLLVECDMRKPSMAKNFNIKSQYGLSSILNGSCLVKDAINENVTDNLDVIPAGDVPPNPSELIGSESMKQFLEASSEIYDYVFLDTPPVNVVTDSQLMNDIIAGIVFVVRENFTAHPDVQLAFERVRLANGRILGFVKTFGCLKKPVRYRKTRERRYAP